MDTPTPTPKRRPKPSAGPVTPGATDTASPRRQSDPASGTPPKPPAPGPTKPRARKGSLEQRLEELFSAPAMLYKLQGDQWAVEHVNEHAPNLAKAWADLADENAAVKRMLNRLTTGSAWGGVVVATGATVLPLLAHHEVLPAQAQAVFNVPTTGQRARGPIVPPPPGSPAGSPPPGPAATGGGGASPSRNGMTPPLRAGEPAGVVTVAGTNNQAVG